MRTVLLVLLMAGTARASVYTVNSTLDTNDAVADALCDDGAGNCTLRAAITQANRDAVADTIAFNIAGPGVHTIAPATSLPTITQPLTIDGRTQPGWAGTPLVELSGVNFMGGGHGLVVFYQTAAPTCAVSGLAIYSFPQSQIFVLGGNATVTANFIGITAAGVAGLNNNAGIFPSGSGTIVIGGPNAADRNIISGNNIGLLIGAPNVRVQGNYIGTDATGMAKIPNNFGALTSSSGSALVDANLISGNNFGVGTSTNSVGLTVEGNLIGTNAAGTAPLGNLYGVYLSYGASLVRNNTISGNTAAGVFISGSSTTGNVVVGNLIGTTPTGTSAVGNAIGVDIDDSAQNTIGGTDATLRNIISGNATGVQITSFRGQNVVIGNFIGLDPTGAALGNTVAGVELGSSAASNTIGGTGGAATRNVISGNIGPGVLFQNSGTNNRVIGNFIGTSTDGAAARPNGVGVRVDDSDGNIIGTATDGNVISGNSGAGVELIDVSSTNTVAGNVIGTAANSTSALPNLRGVVIATTSNDNLIGGVGAGNVIKLNTQQGIVVADGLRNRLSANVIAGNGGIGIDLASDGVTANDASDNDFGPNRLQNFPIVTQAGSDGTNLWVAGTLNSEGGKPYTLEFFASASCDASGNGEAEAYLGSFSTSTNSSGNATFATSLPPIAAGQVVTATAFNTDSGTSELSGCRTIVSCPAVTVSPSTIPGGNVSTAYSQTLTASGATAPYTFTRTSGSLPTGMSLSTGGVLSGTPTQGGSFTFTATAADVNGCRGARTYTLVVCGGISLVPTALPGGNTQNGYNNVVGAIGGTPSYSFAVTAGTLPANVSLASNGTFSGIPSAPGTYDFTVTTTDAAACTGSRPYSVVISDCSGLSVTPATLPNPVVGTAYSEVITGSGGVMPYTMFHVAGTLPSGLSFSSGTLSGTPTTAQVRMFTLRARDANLCIADRPYTVTVTGASSDMATPPDMIPPPDMTTAADMTAPPDMSAPQDLAGADLANAADLAGAPDLANATDLAGMDLAGAPDLLGAEPADLAQPVPSDLATGGSSGGGCSCRTAGGQTDAGSGLLLALVALALSWRRRRARP